MITKPLSLLDNPTRSHKGTAEGLGPLLAAGFVLDEWEEVGAHD